MKTFGELTVGTVVSFRDNETGDNTNYAILRHFGSVVGDWTQILNLKTLCTENKSQHTAIEPRWSVPKNGYWSIVKEN